MLRGKSKFWSSTRFFIFFWDAWRTPVSIKMENSTQDRVQNLEMRFYRSERRSWWAYNRIMSATKVDEIAVHSIESFSSSQILYPKKYPVSHARRTDGIVWNISFLHNECIKRVKHVYDCAYPHSEYACTYTFLFIVSAYAKKSSLYNLCLGGYLVSGFLVTYMRMWLWRVMIESHLGRKVI